MAGELGPAELAKARRTAAQVLHQRREIAAAGRLYADAEAWADLDRLIVEACQSTYPLVGTDVLGQWLRWLPADRRETPAALLLEGTLLQATDLAGAQARLGRAGQQYQAAGDVTGEISCWSHLALVAWWEGDETSISALMSRVTELSTAPALGRAADSLAALSTWLRLVNADLAGDTTSALAALDSVSVTRLSDDWQSLFDFYRGLHLLVRGDPAAALACAERALERATETARPGTWSLVLGCLFWLGRLDEVIEHLPQTIAPPQAVVRTRVAEHALATIYLAQAGQVNQAAEHLTEAEIAFTQQITPMTQALLAGARLALALTRDDEAACADLARHLHTVCADGPTIARVVDLIFLPVQYVLVPSCRPSWDAAQLSGCLAVARELARAVVTVRRGQRPAATPLPDMGLMRAFLPAPWVVELAHTTNTAADLTMGDDPRTGPCVEVQVLGPLRLLRDGAQVVDPGLRRARVRQLLAYLVLHRVVTRQQLAAALWPDLDERAAGGNLRVNLTHLSQLLEPDRPARTPSQLLRRSHSRIELAGEPRLRTDVWTMERLLDDAARAEQQRTPSVALAHYLEALGHYHGPLLEGEAAPDWLLEQRTRITQRFVAASVRAGQLLIADRAIDEALQLAQRALAADACSEQAHQILVSAYLAVGDLPDARRALADCHRILDALGAPPDAVTRMLTRRVGEHDAGFASMVHGIGQIPHVK